MMVVVATVLKPYAAAEAPRRRGALPADGLACGR
jgi:hypothetical protein